MPDMRQNFFKTQDKHISISCLHKVKTVTNLNIIAIATSVFLSYKTSSLDIKDISKQNVPIPISGLSVFRSKAFIPAW